MDAHLGNPGWCWYERTLSEREYVNSFAPFVKNCLTFRVFFNQHFLLPANDVFYEALIAISAGNINNCF